MSPAPARPARGIDHVVIAVRDLDRAEAQYRQLGFALTPRGHHVKLGSYNHCAMFGTDYLELLAQGTPPRPALDRFLRTREGILGIALRTADARRTFADMRDQGVAIAEPVDFGRPVDMPGGPREARFTTTELDNDSTAGLRVFFCEHKTPELVWLREFQSQPNGVTGLSGLTIVDTGGRLESVLGRALGEASRAIEYLTPPAAAERFIGDHVLAVAPPYVAAIRLRVADRAATARFLEGAGMATRKLPSGALQVSSRDGMGAVLEFA
ncbi:MAG TPA: VOC family protein [Stellaceae bacterium]|nr:VOC family protein [Stellaceae bacterium]